MNKKLVSLFVLVLCYSNNGFAIDLSELISGNIEDNLNQKVELTDNSFKISNANPMVNRLNDIRGRFGLPNLNKNYSLMNAASNHAYYLTDKDTLSHYQNKDDPKFTGVTPLDRAMYAGYGKGQQYVKVGEVVAMYNGRQQKDDLSSFLMAIYHRLTILNPTFTDYGELRISNGFKSISEMKVGTTSEDDKVHYIYYPYDNMNNTPTLFLPYQEEPNPMPGYQKVGYPISFQISDGNDLKISEFFLKDSSGSLIQGKIMNSSTDSYITSSQFAFIPFQELKNNETYYVTIVGSANNWPSFKKSWSFTTESKREPTVSIEKETYYPNEIVRIYYDNVTDSKVKMGIQTDGGNGLLLESISPKDTWGTSEFKTLPGCKIKNGCNATFTLKLNDGQKIQKKFTIMP